MQRPPMEGAQTHRDKALSNLPWLSLPQLGLGLDGARRCLPTSTCPWFREAEGGKEERKKRARSSRESKRGAIVPSVPQSLPVRQLTGRWASRTGWQRWGRYPGPVTREEGVRDLLPG